MSIDLDAIEAALVPQYDQYGRGANDWHVNIEVRARTEWLPALVAELRATTADLAVAVEVARERGEEVERLRAVAEAARQFREAERGGRFAKSDLHSTIAAFDRMRDTERALDAALDAWRGGDTDD